MKDNNVITYYRLAIEHLEKEIKELATDEKVRRYLAARGKLAMLYNEQENYEEYSKKCEINSCRHLFTYKDKRHKNFTCVRCGLSNGVLRRRETDLLPRDRASLSYILDYRRLKIKKIPGTYTNIICENLGLVRETYLDIKEALGELPDEEMAKCLKKTLKIANKTIENRISKN